jgi:hypothetical protein
VHSRIRDQVAREGERAPRVSGSVEGLGCQENGLGKVVHGQRELAHPEGDRPRRLFASQQRQPRTQIECSRLATPRRLVGFQPLLCPRQVPLGEEPLGLPQSRGGKRTMRRARSLAQRPDDPLQPLSRLGLHARLDARAHQRQDPRSIGPPLGVLRGWRVLGQVAKRTRHGRQTIHRVPPECSLAEAQRLGVSQRA